MCEILKILMDRGYDVTLISPGNYTAQSIHYRSIPQIIFENEFAIQQLNNKSSDINNALVDNDPFKLMTFVRKLAVQSYIPFYNIYKQVAEENEADLFFCDFMPVVNHPCFDLAWKLGKPAVGISTDTSIISNAPYKSDPMFGCHANMENEHFMTDLNLVWNSIDIIRDINAKRANVGVDPHWDLRGRVSNLLMLSNTFFGFEVSSSDSPLHQEIGPVLPDTFPGLTPVLDSFLVDHPRTIYFALGTNAIISSQNVIIILNAFIKLIDQNVIDGVIWSTVRTDISESIEYANSSVSISTILNKQHPNIHISKFSPQLAILYHENTKLFLSHGGAGSSHESMYTGTPMLVLPIMGDQPRNAEMLESAGMVLKLSKNDLKVDDIVSKVERLLNEESFKNNAERVQFLAKVNSKRKYRAADLMEIVLNTARYEGVKDENGGFKIDNEKLLRDWITPDTRMGFIRGKYLDVYGVAIILLLALGGGFVYTLWKIRYFYITFRKENRGSQKSLNLKKKRN
ncbi:Glycosyltransferase Family 1 protein [Gigaspora rosea]|uniref:Glycosyltransferase Family 1 protein n=1 Tax=Gigaspora rosea TaxID=44941 RepID=A0A397W006_9GLOM|nr:Glycosyltransferase Family 1 protein [Gigaspora rosea]